jgi:hypothetical protein
VAGTPTIPALSEGRTNQTHGWLMQVGAFFVAQGLDQGSDAATPTRSTKRTRRGSVERPVRRREPARGPSPRPSCGDSQVG